MVIVRRGAAACMLAFTAACTETTADDAEPSVEVTTNSTEAITPPLATGTPVNVAQSPARGWTLFEVDYAGREAATYSTGGDWFFTWGGAPDRSAARPTDGLLFDLEAGAFSAVPDAPLDSRRLPASVWTGTEFLVFGGQSLGQSFVDGAAFDPETRTWRPIAPAPFAPAARPVATWHGSKMFVWLPDRDSAFASLPRAGAGQFASYDPATDHWETLPSPPVNVRDVALMPDDRKIRLAGGPPMRDIGTTGPSPGIQSAAFDLATGSWSEEIDGPTPGESVRLLPVEGEGPALFSAFGAVQSFAGPTTPVFDPEIGCWWDIAVASGGGRNFLKWCGNVSELAGTSTIPLLIAGDPGSTNNTYGSAFVADERGRLITFGDSDSASNLPTGKSTLAIYEFG